MLFDDIAATIQALLSGQVDVAGYVGLHGRSPSRDRNPDKKIENKFTVTTAFYAAAVKPGDHDLLRFVNTWVCAARATTARSAQIYEKYTGVKLVTAADALTDPGRAPRIRASAASLDGPSRDGGERFRACGASADRCVPSGQVSTLAMKYVFQFGIVADHVDALIAGAIATLRLSRSWAHACGLALAIVCAYLRAAGPKPVRWVVAAYVEVIRNTPFLVQLFVIYFSLPAIGVRLRRRPGGGARHRRSTSAATRPRSCAPASRRSRAGRSRPGARSASRRCASFASSSCSRRSRSIYPGARQPDP